MSKFKTGKQKQVVPTEKIISINFLFYDYDKEKLDNLQQSISRINKDQKKYLKFFILHRTKTENPETDSGDITFLNPGNKMLPEFPDKAQAYIVMPLDRLTSAINFNDFLKPDDLMLPDSNGFSNIVFKDQPPFGTGCYILGEEFYQTLSGIQGKRNENFENDFLWHAERSCENPGRSILNQTIPFKRPDSFYKKLHFNTQPINRWFEWNFGVLFQKDQKFGNNPASQRLVFTTLSIVLLILIPILSFHAGISGDEEKHHLHAEKVYNYFQTGGEDSTALLDERYKLHYYSQSFDLLAFVIAEKFNIEKVYELRHVLNGFIGALAIITTSLFVRFLAGNFAGILTLLFLFISPRFLGHAMNNPLDIPFAFGYIFTLFHIFRFLRKLPAFSLKHSFWIFFGIAFTTSIRIGGMVLIPYFVMFSGLYLLLTKWPWKIFTKGFFVFAGKGSIYIIIISLAGYFISLLPWPYALQAPVKNPFNALEMMSNITVALRVLFEGQIIWSDALPWYYIPKNMIISIPILILVSFIIPLFIFFRKNKRYLGFWIFMLYFAVIFPVTYIIIKESNVYGGWRHLLFVYPAFVALAAIGLNWIRNSFNKTSFRIAFTILILLGLVKPAIHIINNYPLHYIYFNQLTGGVNKAYKKYETDYYLHSLKPGTEYIIENLKPADSTKKLNIISNASAHIMRYYYRDNLDWINYPYTRYYDRGSYDWDYAIFFCNYIDPFHLKKGIWPPKNTIHEIKVDDVTVCAIVERKNKDDYEGIKYFQEGFRERNSAKVEYGLEKLESAVKYDPHNEIAFLSLGRGYTAIQEYEKARTYLNLLLEIYPNYDKAIDALGYSYLSEAESLKNPAYIDRAIALFKKAVGINYKYASGYHNLGMAYMMKGDDNMAMNYFQEAIRLNGRFKQSYYGVANILERRGDHENARRYIEYANSL